MLIFYDLCRYIFRKICVYLVKFVYKPIENLKIYASENLTAIADFV